ADLTFAAIPAPGLTVVHGGFPHADAKTIVMSTQDGAAAGLVIRDNTESVMWEWIGTEVAGVRDLPRDGLVVFHREGLFMALRIVS
ncbi:MAG: hypothetical protein PF508_16710, partial [Spirochaeta sp.]|nr:hypothetical protein [Spirochaeta sp.]